jgi:hypothetical protein
MSRNDVNTLALSLRKILGTIFGPVKEKCVWRIGTNQELMNLYREPDIILEIRKGRLGWLEHVEIIFFFFFLFFFFFFFFLISFTTQGGF